MLGVLKTAAWGAALSYGAVTFYELPERKLEAAVQATGSVAGISTAASRPIRKMVRTAGASHELAPCKAARRKRWVEGEGWVVRRSC
jgi:hypothetical protein